jgi:hypothetical protein
MLPLQPSRSQALRLPQLRRPPATNIHPDEPRGRHDKRIGLGKGHD